MRIDIGAQFHFFDAEIFLLFARFIGLFADVIFIFAIVEQFTNRRRGIGGDLDQIKRLSARELLRFLKRDDASIFALTADEAHFASLNHVIDAQSPRLPRWCYRYRLRSACYDEASNFIFIYKIVLEIADVKGDIYPFMSSEIEFIEVSGRQIAYRRSQPNPADKGVIWLGSFASDMDGTKASFLADWAAAANINFLRFDYSGCGHSKGDFYASALSHWREEAEAVFAAAAPGKALVIASSMGAWIALHVVRRFQPQIAAMIFIAPAPDFTHKLLSEKLRQKIIALGRLPAEHPSGPLSHLLIEDAGGQLVMGERINLTCPVHMLLGLQDDVVSLAHVLELVELISAPDVQLTLIKHGDHRLSEPDHLAQLRALAEQLYAAL